MPRLTLRPIFEKCRPPLTPRGASFAHRHARRSRKSFGNPPLYPPYFALVRANSRPSHSLEAITHPPIRRLIAPGAFGGCPTPSQRPISRILDLRMPPSAESVGGSSVVGKFWPYSLLYIRAISALPGVNREKNQSLQNRPAPPLGLLDNAPKVRQRFPPDSPSLVSNLPPRGS